MKDKKKIVSTVMASAVLLIGIFFATYAYFTATGDLTEKSDVTVTTSSRDQTISTSTDVSLTVTSTDMSRLNSSNNYDAFVESDEPGEITIKTTVGSGGGTVLCTHDILYEPYTNGVYTTSAENEIGLREYVIRIEPEENDATHYGLYGNEHDLTGETKVRTIASDLKMTVTDIAGEGDITWKITPRYYNLEVDQSDNAGVSFGGTLEIANVSCTNVSNYNPSTPFYSTLLAANTGKENIEGKGKPNFELAPETNEGLYALPDDYGLSYYFRGAVDNNWVKFGKDKGGNDIWWRVVRINGNGSIKLIYSGIFPPTEIEAIHQYDYINIFSFRGILRTIFSSADALTSIYPCKNVCNVSEQTLINYIANESGISQEDIDCIENCGMFKATIKNTPYNENIPEIPEYIGYMYEEGKHRGHEEDSTIKTTIDEWYEENLINYENYLSDFIVCNDRGFEIDDIIPASGYVTQYAISDAMHRLNNRNQITSISCKNKEDAFTVKDIFRGNKLLTHPIGLLTVDEAIFSGLDTGDNSFLILNSYTNSGGSLYWLGSPGHLVMGSSLPRPFMYYVNFNGDLDSHFTSTTSGIAPEARPVISISSDLSVTGTGYWNDPYVVILD